MSASSEPAHGAFETPGPIGEVAVGPSRGSRPLRTRDSASTLDMGKHGTKTARYLTEEERKRATELLLAGGKVRVVAHVLGRAVSTIQKVKDDVIRRGVSWKTKRTKTRKSKLDDPQYRLLVLEEMQRSGGRVTSARVAGILGCARSTAHAWQKRHNFPKVVKKGG